MIPEFSSWDFETWILILSISWWCTLVLGTGNWVQNKWHLVSKWYKATYNIGFNLCSLLQSSDPSIAYFWSCLFSLQMQVQSALPAGCMFHISLPWPPAGTLSGSLPVPPRRCSARPRVPDWKMEVTWHGVGCRNLLSRFECCSLRYRVHVCSQTRWLKSGCDYRVEVLFCSVVHIDCCLLAARGFPHFLMVTITAVWG